MPIVNLKEILTAADKGKYGVGAFNTLNLEMTKGIIQAAEEENSPVIIQIAELLFPLMADWEALTAGTLIMAKESKVQVVVHLDHGMTYKNIAKAINCGFSGVMTDGSHLSFDENVRQTKDIVNLAHAVDIPVEAELGTVPGEEGVYSTQVTVMTDVALAEKFIKLTGADALAVCIGNVHGNFIKTPCLDFSRLRDIKKVSSVPLVLHGGSGLTDDDFKKCIEFGINKVNIFTDLCVAAASRISSIYKASNEIQYPKMMMETIDAVKVEAIKKMKLFGSSNKS